MKPRSANVRRLTDADFKQVAAASKRLVLVDFMTPACAPCHALAPTVDAIADELVGTLDVFEVDTDESPDTAVDYMVRGVPTLLILRDGATVERLFGAKSRKAILEAVRKHLANA